MMKKVSYLTALVVILALFVLGCGQGAPNASSRNEVVPQIDATTVSSEDETVPQQTPALAVNPIGNCCPPDFVLEPGFGDPADRNEDGAVCRRITTGGTITIDNIAPSECTPCLPPDCGR